MIESKELLTRAHGWLVKRCSSTVACHVVGGVVVSAMMIAIGWLWTQDATRTAEINVGGETVSVAEARNLVADAGILRAQDARLIDESELIERRIESLRTWLAADLTWSEMEDAIRSIAEESDVRLASLNDNGGFVGTRVGCLTASGRARGTFASLAEFLAKLHQAEVPIDCSEIEIERHVDMRADDPRSQTPCMATFTLRSPYVAPSGLAAKLLTPEQ